MADRSPVPAEDPFPRSRVRLGEQEMAYVDVGTGDPIVFLHGNPTSSYLWRNVIPHVQHLGRCLAPDLIGMGESSKLADPAPGSYSFATHAGYLAQFLAHVEATERVTLVLHDWGSALGFDWAASHPTAVRGIAFTEAIVNPLIWADWPRDAKRVFQAMRGPDGERKVLDENVFVWSTAKPRRRVHYTFANKDGVEGLAWLSDGVVASAGGDHCVALWNVASDVGVFDT